MSKARGPYRVDPLGYKKKSNEALDKKAKNARELGLDYEPAQQEPVAWRYTDARGHYRYRGFVADFDKKYPMLKPQPLYTSPPAQRKPLTEGEIIKCWGQASGTRHGYVAFARAIEAAHGIKENT